VRRVKLIYSLIAFPVSNILQSVNTFGKPLPAKWRDRSEKQTCSLPMYSPETNHKSLFLAISYESYSNINSGIINNNIVKVLIMNNNIVSGTQLAEQCQQWVQPDKSINSSQIYTSCTPKHCYSAICYSNAWFQEYLCLSNVIFFLEFKQPAIIQTVLLQ